MAAELIGSEGPLQGIVLSLEEGTEWVLGRDPESCQLVVEDPKVARKALIIRLTDDGYSVESLSGEPLEINGRSLNQAPLNDGDSIKLGDTRFTFYPVEEFEEVNFGEPGASPSPLDEELDYEQLQAGGALAEGGGAHEEPKEEEGDWEIAEGESEDFEPEEFSETAAVESEQPQEQKAEEPALHEAKPEEPKPEEPKPEEAAPEEAKAEPPAPEEEFVQEDQPKEETHQRLEEVPEPLEEMEHEGMEAAAVTPEGEEFEEETLAEEEAEEEPLFAPEEEASEVAVDLTPSVRFLLKVIAGPNTGAEFALDMGRDYLIGTEAGSCDIVFHDLSVSREHAKLYLSESGELAIEDLGSRNGVLIDQEQITGRVPLSPNVVVSLGTTAFFVIDREAPQETIVAPTFEAPRQPEIEEEEATPEEKIEEPVAAKKAEEEKPLQKPGISIYVSIVSGVAILLAILMISLFHTKELKTPPKDYMMEIREAVQNFPGVKYTYSPNSNRLFLVGHVATGIEKDELFYNLNALSFLKGVDDHVVNDEAVWQEMNILLSKHGEFKGVSMHSPRPAVFVLSGYIKKEKQAADLVDWMNTHFNYLNLLENRVVVEEQVMEEVSSQLLHNGFGAVAVTFNTGDLVLAGYVGSAQAYEFERLVNNFRQLPGVRSVQNFVVVVAPEQQVIDLNQRYPGRFKVTGYSKHGDVSINVVINGRILARGDTLEGMTLTSIQPHAVFFEKDGLKYKLEYNK